MQAFKAYGRVLISSPTVFFGLVGLYPIVFLISKNWFAYSTEQLIFLATVPGTTCLFGLLIQGLGKLIKNVCVRCYKRGVWDLALVFAGFSLLFLLLEVTLTGSRPAILGFIISFIASSFIVRKSGFIIINIMILSMIIISTVEMMVSVPSKLVENNTIFAGVDKERDGTIKFVETPNIYLIHLESFHSPIAMQHLYYFSNQDFTDNLASMGFYVSQDSYSNYPTTLSSVATIFLQQHHYYKYAAGLDDAVGLREMIGGKIYNPTLAILKNNGYRVSYLHADDYIFRKGDSNYLNYRYPAKSLSESLLIFQSDKIKWLRSKLIALHNLVVKKVPSTNKTLGQVIWNKLENKENLSRPHFYYIKYTGASHTPPATYTWINSEEGWVDKYQKWVKSANPGITSLVAKITKAEPKGIIILYGDHGAW